MLAANTYAARAVAGTVLAQLDEYADQIVTEARALALVDALARRDDAALQALSEGIQARHAGIAYWFVLDTEGALRAIVPSDQPGTARDWHRSYAFRDYFRGAMALVPNADRPVYVSRAYLSTTDQRYKVALVSPVRGADGAPLGLLAAEIATDRRLGALDLSDDRRLAVLTVRRDREAATEALPDEHILLAHGGVAHGERVLVESRALRRLTARRDEAGLAGRDQLRLPPPSWVEADDDYRDPVATLDRDGAGGPWLAGFAAVGGTELAVIVQTRVDHAAALDATPLRVQVAWSVGGAVLLFAGLLAALRTTRSRPAEHASRAKAPPPPV